jgi:hypothetical protein
MPFASILPSVAVIINSCFKFHETTIPYIIDSAKNANIPASNIYIVVGECDSETDIIQLEDYNIILCKYVNIDYNGVIYFTQTNRGLEELQKYTHFFYMHDTCIFIDNFWKTVLEAASDCTSYIKLKQDYSASSGLFSVTWFIMNKKELLSYFINYEKELALAYKASNYPNQDVIYKKFNNLPRHLGEDAVFIFENYQPLGPFFNYVYGSPSFIMRIYSNEPRKGNIFSPGIIKFNKNWRGGDEDFQWNLDL